VDAGAELKRRQRPREGDRANPLPQTLRFAVLPDCTLPLFTSASPDTAGSDVLYYAPGYLSIVPAEVSGRFESELRSGVETNLHVGELRRHAVAAEARWESIRTRTFEPVCLTVYPSNRCNSACEYCCSAASPSSTGPAIRLDDVVAAASLVAANCRARSLPLTVVLHGGGEPTLDRPLADAILDAAGAAASSQGLAIFRYVATNGIMSAARAAWLSRRFDLIGLSCDGPSWIQDRQRPLPGGRSSSPAVERTARVAREAGTPLHVRVTITPESLTHQCEIAEYVCSRLGPSEIHVEPAYPLGRAAEAPGARIVASQAEEFVSCFLAAREVARGRGVEWSCSMVRPTEVHGTYCEVFRDVLHVVPGGAATACFATVDGAQAVLLGMDIGGRGGGGYEIRQGRVRELRASLSLDPTRCEACFNRFHCSRGCPEACPARAHTPADVFRCRVEELLALAYLRETAKALMAAQGSRRDIIGGPVSVGLHSRVDA